jgi:carbon monoxide dehydrogenase subunit G
MDKLLNEFTVHRPIEETWTVLTDVERIAPCMPGAVVKEIEGDVFRGVVKVKLGAISTAFKGEAKFVERDDSAHRAVLAAEGRDTSGRGNAAAHVTATLHADSPDTTKVAIETDLHITGKVAQFGRGIMGDVSKKLIAQFATNLNKMLESSNTPNGAAAKAESPATTAPSGSDVTVDAPAGAAAATAGVSAGAVAAAQAPRPTVRKIEGPAAEPVELSELAGGAILKRTLPLIGGLVLLVLLWRRLRRR